MSVFVKKYTPRNVVALGNWYRIAPGLVQSLLSGSMALSGSDMTQLMATTAKGAGGTVGAVRVAVGVDWFDGGDASFSAQDMKNGAKNFEKKTMSTMGQLGKAAFMATATKNPVTKGCQSAINSLAGDNGLLKSKMRLSNNRFRSKVFNIETSSKNATEMLDSSKNPEKYNKDKEKNNSGNTNNKNDSDNQSTTTSDTN